MVSLMSHSTLLIIMANVKKKKKKHITVAPDSILKLYFLLLFVVGIFYFMKHMGAVLHNVKMQNLNIKVLSKVCEILRVPRCFLSIFCYIKLKKLQPARIICPTSHEALQAYVQSCMSY